MKPLRNRLKVVILLILDVVNLAVSVVPALLTKRDECCCFNLTRQNSLKKNAQACTDLQPTNF